MSNVLSESTVDCHTLQDVDCSDHCAITVAFNPSYRGVGDIIRTKHLTANFTTLVSLIQVSVYLLFNRYTFNS